MATSKKFSVPKGFKHLIKARGVGYYDYAQLFEGTDEDTSVNIKAQSYDGLSMVQESNDFGSADTVDFSKTILPWKWDYYNTLLTSKYCLMPQGETYKVVDTYVGSNISSSDYQGSPSITEKGIFTPSSSNYLKLSSNSISNYTGSLFTGNYSWAWTIKFKSPSDVSQRSRIFTLGYGVGDFNIWCALSEDTGSSGKVKVGVNLTSGWKDLAAINTLSPDTWYWLRVSRDYANGLYKMEMSTDGKEWTTEVTLSSSDALYNTNATFHISQVNSDYIALQYDLTGCSFVSDYDNINWTATSYKPKKELGITPISASKVEGTVVYAPFRLEEISRNITFYKDKSFEIKVKIITPEAEYSKYQEFITLSDTNASGDESGIIFLRKNPNNQFDAGLYTRANSYWNTGRGGTYTSNKECYLRIYYKPSNWSLYFYTSYTGDSWTQVYAISMMNFFGYDSEVTEVTPLIYFGSWGDGTSEVMQTGAIDFGESFIYVDGVEVWRGTKNALTTIEGCTYNYTDNGQATTLNCFVVNGNERVVLTSDNDFNGRYLGTVDIAEHTAYDYVDGEWVERLNPAPPITPFSE